MVFKLSLIQYLLFYYLIQQFISHPAKIRYVVFVWHFCIFAVQSERRSICARGGDVSYVTPSLFKVFHEIFAVDLLACNFNNHLFIYYYYLFNTSVHFFFI